jgi:hypothetical protein
MSDFAAKEVLMMRARLTPLVLSLALGSLALAAAAAWASGGARVDRVAAATSPGRTSQLALQAAPDDLALAIIRFHAPSRARLSSGDLQIAVEGAFGSDYLASATPRTRTAGGPRALVLLLDRPSPLLDPVSVHLRMRSLRVLGTPRSAIASDPFSDPGGPRHPRICELPLHGSSLTGAQLLALRSRGAPLAGFPSLAAIAQAYDVVCGLSYDSSFRAAVTRISPAPVSPTPAPPETPVPVQPTPHPPGCTPCDPPPGSACPLTVKPSVCFAAADGGARRAAASAH